MKSRCTSSPSRITTHGTEIDFGQFVTSAGAEVIEANSNWNYSRSLLFAWAIPYYHMGIRTSTPITKEWTVGIQVVNAWNMLWGNNDFKNVGITSALTKTKYTWSVNYYVGPNNLGTTTTGVRNLVDTTLLLTPKQQSECLHQRRLRPQRQPDRRGLQRMGRHRSRGTHSAFQPFRYLSAG